MSSDATSERRASRMYNVEEVLEDSDTVYEVKVESVKWNMPEGEDAVKFVSDLSRNMKPEVHQKYITLGVVSETFPKVPTEKIIAILKKLGRWED
tara:strand:- start:68 stop:352 length:285 start_codon:yes stop_codon:yes gene_type:complete